LIYDTAPVGLAFLSPDCRYLQINRRLTEICGISVADHIGRSVRETVPQVADQVEAIVQTVIRTGEAVTGIEVNGQRPDKLNIDRIWSTAWHPLKRPDGSIVGINVVAEEITERKRTEQARSQLSAIVESSADAIYVYDFDGIVLSWNRSAEELFGYASAEIIGRNIEAIIPPALERQAHHRIVAAVRAGQSLRNLETLQMRRDGSIVSVLSTASPIRNASGEAVAVSVVSRDISARKEAEEKLFVAEERFRTLAENMSQFAWMADEKGSIFWYNKRWYDYTGTSLETMQGWGWQAVHHPEHVEAVVRRIRVCFETGTPWEDTFPLRGRDGNYRWFLSRAMPIRDDGGSIVRWFGTNTDVTEQIEAEKALRELNATLGRRVAAETRERLQIWNVCQDLLMVADLEGGCLSVNPAWTETLGWSEPDLVGRSWEWLLHPDDREQAQLEIGQLAAGGKPLRFENRLRHKEGPYRWISWTAAADSERIYATGRDVTGLKDAEDKLRLARRELARAGRRTAMDVMSAAIAHEIRQPLGAIVYNAAAGLRWLSRTAPSLDEARETFKSIAADGHRANEIIQSVRAMFTRNEQAGTTVDVNELICEAIALVQGELDVAGIAVQLELDAQRPSLAAHKGQLQQVILNLVLNAIDAMRAVTERARVLTVRSDVAVPGSVTLSVQDSGIGIDSAHIDRIFDHFFTTKTDGMGMGLAICRLIVEAHGGTLSAAQGVPHGSIFSIILPNADDGMPATDLSVSGREDRIRSRREQATHREECR
jgi:PAS domain S-box-containing protein